MGQKFVVREARASDKDLVLRFCQNTFEWGDYIPNVWDFWLNDSDGRIFLATFEDVPVGMSHVEILKADEAWLEGARVAPEFRRMSVASLLNEACLEWAVKHGARIARLVTESSNYVAQKALMKLNFKGIFEWALMEFDGCKLEVGKSVRFADASDVDAIWKFLMSSEGFAKSGELFTILFRWMSLDQAGLERFVGKRMAIVYEQARRILGLVLFDDAVKDAWQENSVQTCFVDGDFEAVLSMGQFLQRHLYNEGVARIYGVMCNCAPLTSAFAKLGFRARHTTELVYEKKLYSV
jgi:GNAT superfamily N-acetyltransferase